MRTSWLAMIGLLMLAAAILCAALTGLALLAGYVLPGGTLAFSTDQPRYNHNIYLLDVNRGWLWSLTKGDKFSHTQPIWSPDGQQILFATCDLTDCEAETMSASGGDIRPEDRAVYSDLFSLSPDGARRISLADVGHLDFALVMTNQSDGVQEQLTTTDSRNAYPAWSPDSEQIAFASDRDGNWEIYVMNADGTDQRRLTYNDDATDIEPAWSPDGRQIAFISDRDGINCLCVMEADGSNVRRLVVDTWDNQSPAWRP